MSFVKQFSFIMDGNGTTSLAVFRSIQDCIMLRNPNGAIETLACLDRRCPDMKGFGWPK